MASAMLQHPFFNPAGVAPQLQMCYHGFMSHQQADASGTVSTLFLLYQQRGLHNWIDMRQEVLTLDGMRNGVCDSAIFILILTKHVLGSWFCQQEMLCAIEEEKPIQLVLEQESRFSPFDAGGHARIGRVTTSAKVFARTTS